MMENKELQIIQTQEELEVMEKMYAIIKRKQAEIEQYKPDAESWRAFSGSGIYVDARSAANTLTRSTGYNVQGNVTLYKYLRAIGVVPDGYTYVKKQYEGKRFDNGHTIINGRKIDCVHFSADGIAWLAEQIMQRPLFLKKLTSRQLKNRGLIER